MPENKAPVGMLAALMVCCFGHLILVLLATGTAASILTKQTIGIIIFGLLLVVLTAYLLFKRVRRL